MSSETTSTGRGPPCSWPRTGSSSPNQISPRTGLATGNLSLAPPDDLPIFRPNLVRIQAVHQRRVPGCQLVLPFRPGGGIFTQARVGSIALLKDSPPAILLDRAIEGRLH